MARVYLCRAHSAKEPGFHVPKKEGLNEWYFSEEFTRGAARALQGSDHDVEILPSTLGLRIAHIKAHYRKNPGERVVAVEMHCNQMPGRPLQRGWFVMAWHSSEEAIKMARSIIREVRKVRPDKCRGINKVSHDRRWVGTGMEYPDDPLGFLERIPYPSLIVETGYLSNPLDAAWLSEERNRFLLGHAVGLGIRKYLEV
jgi:hypothetical protein